MHKFLDTNDLLKLTQENINHLKRSIMSNEIEVVIISQQNKPKTRWTHC
jgi:hypothetical protein